MKKKHILLGLGVVGGLVAWKMLSRAETVDWETDSQYLPHRDKSKFISIDGIRIHYQHFGSETSQKTMILIHGYNSSTFVWRTVAPMLAERGFEVIALDMVGYGFSEKPEWFDYSIQSQARMIVRFMNRLGIGKAILVGSSYGGAVAASIALDYPERVEKLVLVGTVCNNDPLSHPLMRMAKVPLLSEVVSALLIDSKPFIKWRMKNTLSPKNYDLISKERIEGVRKPLAAKDTQRAIIATARRWDANRIERDAHLINQPTLIIWGEDDKVVSLANARKLYDEILRSKLVVFKDCGHIPQEEKPEDFVQVVTAFAKDEKAKSET